MSPRARTDKLPPYVYKRRYVYVVGTYDRQTRKTTYKRLCGINASIGEVWQAYEALGHTGNENTFRWLSNLYLESPKFAAKADKTRKEYQAAHRRICDTATNVGSLGEVPLKSWTTPMVQVYLDKNVDRAVAANREKAYMSLVFNWGISRGHCTVNPTKGVERNTERARTRYVTDTEYEAAYQLAKPHVRVVMELTYMMRARLSEVLDLTRDSILDEGVHLVRRKGSKDAVVTWTPRLREAISAAKKLPRPNDINRHLFQSKHGTRMPESTIQTAWQRMKVDFTIHDLKAKGVSDFEGDKVAAGGWKDAKMVNVYDRKVGRIGPSGGE